MADPTPGPWFVFKRSGYSVIGGDGTAVASCRGNAPGKPPYSPETRDRRMANARLCAASHDLLDAAEKALAAFDSGPIRSNADNTTTIGALRDAIAKARGQ